MVLLREIKMGTMDYDWTAGGELGLEKTPIDGKEK